MKQKLSSPNKNQDKTKQSISNQVQISSMGSLNPGMNISNSFNFNQTTIAQLNRVSIKQSKQSYHLNQPFRIRLPQYFNIPSFQDKPVPKVPESQSPSKENHAIPTISQKEDSVFKKRMKDLTLLAEGMKRSKNIKQQSRYYYTQGVLLHNVQQFRKAIEYFEKFFKIVLYLQDSKSMELVLNVIGAEYMYLGEYSKALQFHAKQQQVSDRSDRFVSKINQGLCHYQMGDYKQAYSLYQQAEKILEDEQNNEQTQKRIEFTAKLIERVQSKLRDNQIFMTQNYNSMSSKQKSPGKSIQSSILKQQSSLLLKKSQSRKQYEQNKIRYAIYAAQQNIEDHLKSSIKYGSNK